MVFSLEAKTASLSVGEFADFAIGPRESGGGPAGLWRAQLGQHWHQELRARAEQAHAAGGPPDPRLQFEVAIEGRLTHRGWTIQLGGRIDQILPGPAPHGRRLREVKSVLRPLPADEAELRADYPAYFRQLAAYLVLLRASPEPAGGRAPLAAELVFVEAGSGLVQAVALTPFDEALVHHQLEALVAFLDQRLRATARRRHLRFRPPYAALRPGQEHIQANLAAAFAASPAAEPAPRILLLEAPTGYGKTGCVLEFALGQMRAGRFGRLIWLTGKSTGQLPVMHTLRTMAAGAGGPAAPPVATWQVRNKAEHCINHTFHCVRDGCSFLRGAAERWPASGLARFHLDESLPRDLEALQAAGREAHLCPYEITRTALAFNDVWLGDYNYVFAPANRGLFFEQPGFDPAETLLVIDEAHNLPARVAGAHSHRATADEAHGLLAELDHLRAPAPLLLAVEAWARLLATLGPADALDPATEAELRDLVARLADLAATTAVDPVALGPRHNETLWRFGALADFLADTRLRKLLWAARAGELEFTCLDAAPAIGETLQAFGGAILMSATLQPYDLTAEACGLAAPSYTTLAAGAPWRAGAYDVAVDLRVDTSYRQRGGHYGTTAGAVEQLAAAATAAAAANPGPVACVAVFFPSYAYAEAVRRALENRGSVLRVALQPRLPDLATQAAWVEENLLLADALFLVLGSSFAEGIDLLGGRVTHAMVVGPALPEVNAVQQARADALAGLGREAAFRRIYQVPGLQKVNQALGRLVRAPGHRAKVLLHCRRFADPSYAALLAADYQQYAEIHSEAELTEWLRPPA
ncbi:MAG: PD-(D/E)XK nuclease family protein [Opitutaceae bacterium]|nr:PD-(D/E)XK nuclease family protein [Opitutaceae bacterium]